jgi:hypothetical protein
VVISQMQSVTKAVNFKVNLDHVSSLEAKDLGNHLPF